MLGLDGLCVVTGSSLYVSRISVCDNDFISASLTRNVAYLEYFESSKVCRNDTHGGGIGMSVGRIRGTRFLGNGFVGGGEYPGIRTVVTASENVFRENYAVAGARTCVLELASPRCIATDNISTYGTAVISSSQATGSVIMNNYNNSELPTISGNFSGTIAGDNFNIGNGESSAGARRGGKFWASSSPQTSFPDRYSSRGDFAFNANAEPSGPLGWQCTQSGKPGVWVAVNL